MAMRCLTPLATPARVARSGSGGRNRKSRDRRATTGLSRNRNKAINLKSSSFRGDVSATTRAIPPDAVASWVDPFGVSATQWEQIEGNLFGVSLLPYLFFLYYLAKPEVKMPRKALFGFKFLLVFVFGTIPCAIFAKVQYGDILANVDWLHGPAESLLTVTNLCIVVGMREGLRKARAGGGGGGGGGGGKQKTLNGSSVGAELFGWSALATAGVVGFIAASAGHVDAAVAAMTDTSALSSSPAVHSNLLAEVSGLFSTHPEPPNALSLPTWVIHVSSLIEWLVAMGLIWEYGDAVGNKAYKGLTWGMVPCHASGIAACTFHLFYNAPVLSVVVATQAGLTVVGNTACAVAAYRMAKNAGADVRMPWDDGFPGFFPESDLESDNKSLGGAQDGKIIKSVESVEGAATAGTAARTGGDQQGTKKLLGWEDLASAWSEDSDTQLVVKLFLVSTALSAVLKWGSLTLEFPFQPTVGLAFFIIFAPTGLNALKWAQIGKREREAEAGKGK